MKQDHNQEESLLKKTIKQEFKEKDKLISFKLRLLQMMMIIESIFSKLAIKIKKDKKVKLKDGQVTNSEEIGVIDPNKELLLLLQ